MADHSIAHATFTLERDYPAPPARVFAAWSDPAAKARWFAGSDGEHELDFRVGGREIARGRAPDGGPLAFESAYHEIVPDERIVFSSTLSAGQTVTTVSVTTVELTPVPDGTRLVLTQQGAFLDGFEEPAWRERGTADQLTALAREFGAG